MARARSTQRRDDQPSKVGSAVRDWLVYTLVRDSQSTIYRVPHVLINWVVILGLAVAWFQWTEWWKVLTAVTVAVFIYSIGRASRQLSAQRKAELAVYERTRRVCKHPNSTVSRPIDPATVVQVRRWQRKPGRPRRGSVVVNQESPAAGVAGRAAAERAIEQSVEVGGQPMVFDHAPGRIGFEVVKPADPRVQRRKTRARIEQTLLSLFPKAGDEFEVSIEWPADASADVPSQIEVAFGYGVAADSGFRATVERSFDERVRCADKEWVYDWSTPAILVISSVDPGDGEAIRKRSARKIADVATTTLGQIVRGAANQADVQVVRWVDDDKPAAHTPVQISIGFGTADFSAVDRRLMLEDRLDQAFVTEWPDRVWLPDWQFGHSGQVLLTAAPNEHKKAKQRTETKHLREIVRSSSVFDKVRGVDVSVDEWDTGGDGRELVVRFVVHYGTADMTDGTKRLTFETHLDSKTVNDWRFDWISTPGELQVTAVPPLPSYVPFPAKGSNDYIKWHERFRAGEVLLGPAKGGNESVVKFDRSPHVLIGGATGKGKSQALGLFIYGVLMNPNHAEMVMIDFKVTDWSWTTGYPNVAMYAPTDARKPYEQIAEAVNYVFEQMNGRQMLLQKYSVRSLKELRRAITDGRITDLTLTDVPRRLLLIFDESGAAFDAAKDPEDRAQQDAIRGQIGKIVMLGRAMEVHVVTAAQKPAATNIGTAIMNQLVNKYGVGKVDIYTSQQIFGGLDIGTRGLDGAPLGRGWFVSDAGEQLLSQTLYLPNDDQPDPIEPSVQLRGITTQVAEMLTHDGWVPVKEPKTIVAPDPQGNPVESIVLVDRWNKPDAAMVGSGPSSATSSAQTATPAGGSGDRPNGAWSNWKAGTDSPAADPVSDPEFPPPPDPPADTGRRTPPRPRTPPPSTTPQSEPPSGPPRPWGPPAGGTPDKRPDPEPPSPPSSPDTPDEPPRSRRPF